MSLLLTSRGADPIDLGPHGASWESCLLSSQVKLTGLADPGRGRASPVTSTRGKRIDLTSESLVKVTGIALILSGVLATIGFSLHPHDSTGPNQVLWVGAHTLVMAGILMGLLGLAGLYGVTSSRVGILGFIGFLLATVSLVLYLGKLYWSAFIYPLVIERHPEFIRTFGFIPGSDPVDPVVKTVFYLVASPFSARTAPGSMLLWRSSPSGTLRQTGPACWSIHHCEVGACDSPGLF